MRTLPRVAGPPPAPRAGARAAPRNWRTWAPTPLARVALRSRMGLFDFLKRRPAEPAAAVTPPRALGWEAIEQALDTLHPGQAPRHWKHDGVMRMHDLRNPPENPLDGVHIYDGGSFWHYVGLGLTDLYARESDDDWSGFGYELTFRLAKSDAPEPPLWPIDVIGTLARAVFTGAAFAPGHTVDMRHPLDGPKSQSGLTAVLLTHDPGLEAVRDTPHGKMAFLLVVGVPDSARQRALAEGFDVVLDELKRRDPTLATVV